MKTLKKSILAAMFTAALMAFIACDNDGAAKMKILQASQLYRTLLKKMHRTFLQEKLFIQKTKNMNFLTAEQ